VGAVQGAACFARRVAPEWPPGGLFCASPGAGWAVTFAPLVTAAKTSGGD